MELVYVDDTDLVSDLAPDEAIKRKIVTVAEAKDW